MIVTRWDHFGTIGVGGGGGGGGGAEYFSLIWGTFWVLLWGGGGRGGGSGASGCHFVGPGLFVGGLWAPFGRALGPSGRRMGSFWEPLGLGPQLASLWGLLVVMWGPLGRKVACQVARWREMLTSQNHRFSFGKTVLFVGLGTQVAYQVAFFSPGEACQVVCQVPSGSSGGLSRPKWLVR